MVGSFLVNINSLVNWSNTTSVLDFVFCIVVTAVVIGLLIYFYRKVLAIYAVSGLLALSMLFFILGMTSTAMIVLTLFLIASTLFAFANVSTLRHFFIKPQEGVKKDQKKVLAKIEKMKNDANVTADYDKEALYKTIDETVKILSKKKLGAIMTFEKNTNLDDVMKNGSIINAPVTEELLETIFYVGTRLHDGAVVIRGNMIVAAAVYYQPTSRALVGKYGARHRAAFGISEISDSVTVVVSEETGRVAIAHNGELEPVILDNFYREFSELMSSNE